MRGLCGAREDPISTDSCSVLCTVIIFYLGMSDFSAVTVNL